MKIGLMADTHDRLDAVDAAINFFNQENVTDVLHAGDLVSPFVVPRFSRMTARLHYVCVNKDRPERNHKPYEMAGSTPPESFTNSKSYFVKMFYDVWDRTDEQKLALVYSVLQRIDPQAPGKIRPLDYSDQERMVSTFGANWHEKGDLPNLLTSSVDFR